MSMVLARMLGLIKSGTFKELMASDQNQRQSSESDVKETLHKLLHCEGSEFEQMLEDQSRWDENNLDTLLQIFYELRMKLGQEDLQKYALDQKAQKLIQHLNNTSNSYSFQRARIVKAMDPDGNL